MAIFTAAGFVFVAVLVGVFAVAASREEGPEAMATTWLRALAEGDDEAARAAMTPDAGAAGVGIGDAAERLTDPVVVGVRVDGDSAEVDVSFVLSGEEHDVTLSLARSADRWRVGTDGLGRLSVATTIGDSVTVGASVIPTGEVLLLPGVYEVTAAPADYLDGEASVSVLPARTRDVAIEAGWGAAGVEAVRDALTAHLNACTRAAAAVPDNCGLRVPWPADIAQLERIAYRVERLPEVQLIGGDGFAATGGSVVATATGTGRDGAPVSATYRDDAWGVRGTVAVTGDRIRLGVL